MSLYIQNYSGRHCILLVAKNAETIEILSSKGFNYIFINDEGTQINIDNVRYNVQIKNVNADALEDVCCNNAVQFKLHNVSLQWEVKKTRLYKQYRTFKRYGNVYA